MAGKKKYYVLDRANFGGAGVEGQEEDVCVPCVPRGCVLFVGYNVPFPWVVRDFVLVQNNAEFCILFTTLLFRELVMLYCRTGLHCCEQHDNTTSITLFRVFLSLPRSSAALVRGQLFAHVADVSLALRRNAVALYRLVFSCGISC